MGWQGDTEICAANLAILVFPLTILSIGLIVSLIVNIVGLMAS